MTALAWALAATFGATLIVVCAYSVRLYGQLQDALSDLEDREEERAQDAALIAELRHEGEMKDVAMSDLLTRLRRISAQHQKDKQQGEKAAIAGMEILIRAKAEFEEARQAWAAGVQALMGGRGPAELPAARTPPTPLPSGDFLVEGDPPTILPADGDDWDDPDGLSWLAGPLPSPQEVR